MDVCEELQNDGDDLSTNAEVIADIVPNQVMGDEELSLKASSEIFLEFFEVAIHQILYVRKLYPEEIFMSRKKYNIPVHMSSHPGLNNYITGSLSSIKNLIQQKNICQVSLLIEDGNTPVENFVFEVNVLQNIPRKESDYSELEQSLRSVILRILACGAEMRKLKESCSFEILVSCEKDCETDLNMNDQDAMKWIKVEKGDFSEQLQPNKIIPVKALSSSNILSMQLVVEQMVG